VQEAMALVISALREIPQNGVTNRVGTRAIVVAAVAVACASILGSQVNAAEADTTANYAQEAFVFAKGHFDPKNERELAYGGPEMQFMEAVLELCGTREELRGMLHADYSTFDPEERCLGMFRCLCVTPITYATDGPYATWPPFVEPLLRLAEDCRRIAPLAAPRDSLAQVGWWDLCSGRGTDGAPADCEGAQLADWLCARGFRYLTFRLQSDGQAKGSLALLCSEDPRDTDFLAAQLRTDSFWRQEVPQCMVSRAGGLAPETDGSRYFHLMWFGGPKGFRQVGLNFVDPIGGPPHGWYVRIVNDGGESPGTWKLRFREIVEYGNNGR
jgi:hypothetical protein